MQCEIVSNKLEFDAAVATAARYGMRLACVSSAGLPAHQRRLTFLPVSAFSDTPQGTHENNLPVSAPARPVREIITDLEQPATQEGK